MLFRSHKKNDEKLLYENVQPPIFIPPFKNDGAVTFTPCVPKMLLAACCKIRLMPLLQASRLSLARIIGR